MPLVFFDKGFKALVMTISNDEDISEEYKK
jgi:hypothetical protein